ncbi:flavodoxin family protein [Chloroflexota bacterium]
MKVVAITGSSRPAGNTNYLVDQALDEIASKGFETEKICLSQHRVNPCLGHEDCATYKVCTQNDDARWILEKLYNADGIILSSPVYYYNVSAQMKALIDRNYFYYNRKIRMKASCVGLIAICGGDGTEHTIRVFNRYLKLSADIPDNMVVSLAGRANKQLDTVGSNQALTDEARSLGRRIAEMLTEQGAVNEQL